MADDAQQRDLAEKLGYGSATTPLYPCAQVDTRIPLLCSGSSLIVAGCLGVLALRTIGDLDALFGTACFGF
jgi:hypothetical protein